MLELAAALAVHVRAGDVVALEGELGAGKTTFVRGLVDALVGGDRVSSPSFTFRHRYEAPGRPAVEHLDLFRLEREEELAELGLEEAFGPGLVTVVEWARRAPQLVGAPRWRVLIQGSGTGPRRVTIVRE